MNLTIAELMLQNETSWRSEEEVHTRLEAIWETMRSCVQRGLQTEGVLPGRMMVVRRAPKLYRNVPEC